MAKKILVIDDEEIIVRSLKKLLEQNDFDVFIAKRGQDALVMIEEEDFDLIITDVRMPGVNGVDTAKAITEKLNTSNKEKVPIIFITGYADEEAEKKANALKPIAFIYKPFDIPEFVSRIRDVLK